MGFNSGVEWKKFNEKWKRLRAEYAACGMDEAAIDAIYEYDLSVFNSNRRYAEHTQRIPYQIFDDDGDIPNDNNSALLQKFFDAFSMPAAETDHNRQNSWIDEIDNDKLLQAILQLKDDEIKLLTMLVYEGKTMHEIAEFFGIYQSTVSYRFSCIRKNLKNFSDFSIF